MKKSTKWKKLVVVAGIGVVITCIGLAVLITSGDDNEQPLEQSQFGTPIILETSTLPPEPVLRELYFCGIDRCRDSGEYSQLIFENGINIWNGPEPNRGGVHSQANHLQMAFIVEERRVNDGPGGLWFRLESGGWTNDLWLTEEKCTSSNLVDYSFTDCLMGEY